MDLSFAIIYQPLLNQNLMFMFMREPRSGMTSWVSGTRNPITIDLKREARSGLYFTVPPILLKTLKRMTKNHFSV
eukprot:scaffold19175_cov67-Attheya_sp.AAC.6